MPINKVNSVNFSSRMILKSKDSRFINLLGDIDFYILRKSPKMKTRFDVVATSTKKNGYWQGKLLTGKDIQTPYKVPDEQLPSKVISSLDDILNMPVFKKIEKGVRKLYNEMFSIKK